LTRRGRPRRHPNTRLESATTAAPTPLTDFRSRGGASVRVVVPVRVTPRYSRLSVRPPERYHATRPAVRNKRTKKQNKKKKDRRKRLLTCPSKFYTVFRARHSLVSFKRPRRRSNDSDRTRHNTTTREPRDRVLSDALQRNPTANRKEKTDGPTDAGPSDENVGARLGGKP